VSEASDVDEERGRRGEWERGRAGDKEKCDAMQGGGPLEELTAEPQSTQRNARV
jgi:hypothetical protein